MKILVEFKQKEGNDQETFIIDTTTIPKNKLQSELIKTVKEAFKTKNKEGEFFEYFDYDFLDGLRENTKSSDNHVTIWY